MARLLRNAAYGIVIPGLILPLMIFQNTAAESGIAADGMELLAHNTTALLGALEQAVQ